MKSAIVRSLIATVALVLAMALPRAENLTVNSILVAHKSGATADGIIAMVSNPANTIATSPGDLVTLRAAGVPETVLIAIGNRVAAPAPPPAALQPDDLRLVDFVRLIK